MTAIVGHHDGIAEAGKRGRHCAVIFARPFVAIVVDEAVAGRVRMEAVIGDDDRERSRRFFGSHHQGEQSQAIVLVGDQESIEIGFDGQTN